MERLGMFQYGGGGYHCIWMEDRDFEIFRDRKLTAVTNPSSNLKLASGICPLKRFTITASTSPSALTGRPVTTASICSAKCS